MVFYRRRLFHFQLLKVTSDIMDLTTYKYSVDSCKDNLGKGLLKMKDVNDCNLFNPDIRLCNSIFFNKACLYI